MAVSKEQINPLIQSRIIGEHQRIMLLADAFEKLIDRALLSGNFTLNRNSLTISINRQFLPMVGVISARDCSLIRNELQERYASRWNGFTFTSRADGDVFDVVLAR